MKEHSEDEKAEMEYFLGELEHIQKFVDVPLMTRRLENHKDDPMDELMEVYDDVKEIEG